MLDIQEVTVAYAQCTPSIPQGVYKVLVPIVFLTPEPYLQSLTICPEHKTDRDDEEQVELAPAFNFVVQLLEMVRGQFIY